MAELFSISYGYTSKKRKLSFEIALLYKRRGLWPLCNCKIQIVSSERSVRWHIFIFCDQSVQMNCGPMQLTLALISPSKLSMLNPIYFTYRLLTNIRQPCKIWTRMHRPRLVDTDWRQSITRLQEEEPSNPIIWFLLFHSGHRSHRQYNYV